MNKLLTVVVLLVGLSGCHFGFGIGDSGQHSTYVATDSLGSAVAQASVGNIIPAAY
jgi:hypothetical protein